MNDKKMVIMDIDGVLAQLEPALIEYLSTKYGDRAEKSRHLYCIEDRFNEKDDEEMLADALAFIENPYSYINLAPDQDGIRFVQQLIEHRYHILFLSARPPSSEKFTRRWLIQNVPQFDKTGGVSCVNGRKTKMMLNPMMKDIIAFVVDDNPETVDMLNNSGVMAFVWEQPWNNKGNWPRIIPGENPIAVSDGKKVPFWRMYE